MDVRSGSKPGSSFNSSFILHPPLRAGATVFSPLAALLKDPTKKWEPYRQELASLSGEADNEIFYSSLLRLGERLDTSGRPEMASVLFKIAWEAGSSEFRKKATAKLNALAGNGPPGLRIETFLRAFTKQAVDPAVMISMGIASAAFQLTRFATYSRFLNAPIGNFFTRGIGAKFLANTAGLLVEVPTFSYASKWFGNSSDAGETMPTQMAGTALIIGSVKFIAGAAAFASRRWNYRHLAFRQRRIKKLHAYRSLNRTPDAPVHDSAAQGNRWRSGEYPVFPPRLVKVLSQDSLHGSRNQELTLEAISRLFKYNAARTSIGSWQNALWQNFLEQAVRDPFAVKGERALVAALGVFETLPDLESLNRLSRKFGYLEPEISTQDFRREASAVRRSAQQMDRGRFAESDIEAAIGHARYSPHGRLLFKRLKSVLEGRDTAAKIRELVRDETIPTETFLEDNRRRNLIGDELAATIAGGVHTAYLDDPRLARKVVAVYEEILPYLKNPLLREKNLTKIRRDFFRVGAMHPEMSSKAFVKFLSWQADSQAQAMSLAIQRGRLEIATLPGETFDDYVRENNLPSGCKLSLFLKPRSPGYANLIWLRAMPTPLSTRNPETAFHEFISRMIALFHEGEHYRHFTGEFDPRESLSKPFDIRALDREGRLVTESMAFLEQLRWGIQNVDDDYYQVGRRLGENLAQVARGMADFGYFGESISWK